MIIIRLKRKAINMCKFSNLNTIKFDLNSLFPEQIKIVQLDKLPHNFLQENFTQSPPQIFNSISEVEMEKIAIEIAGFLCNKVNQSEYSFFSRTSNELDTDPGWLLYFAKLNLSDEGFPKEIVLFSYNLNLLGDVKTKLYRILENEEFFKENMTRVSALTKKEKEIIGLLTNGMNSAEIAAFTFTSINTVLTHRKNILKKLKNPGFAGLLKFAEVFDLTTNSMKNEDTFYKHRDFR